MMSKVLGSRWLISGIAITVVAVLMGGLFYASSSSARGVQYCAQFDDAVGLFVGNEVTRRGVPVGTITGVETSGGHAVVRFTAESTQRLPATVEAATVAPSVIAVRQLALIGDDDGGPELSPDSCIPLASTNTPASISESLESISDVAAQLTTAGGPGDLSRVLSSVSRLERELEGTGPVINMLIKQLAVPGNTPITGALADSARIIESVSAMSTGLAGNWTFMESFLTQLTGTIDPLVLPTIGEVVRIIAALPETLLVVNDLLTDYSHFIWPVLDVAVPLARLVGAGFRNYGDILGIVPVLIRAFDITFDQKTLGLRIRYSPPTTRIPAQNPELTCANINRLVPGQCTVTDPDGMEIDSLSLVLTMTGAAR